jgi:putative hydrolase of the HAD superfamily
VPPIAVIAFDIDDTLYLERDYVRSGFQAVGDWCQANLGRSGFGASAWEAFQQGARRDIFDRVLGQWGVPIEQSLIGQLVAVYRRHDPHIALLPDAAECLARLHGRVRLAAISDGPLASQQAKVRRLGLDRWMDEIVLTDALGPGCEKPNPKAFLRIQEKFQCTGAQCLYVADNPAKDFRGPRQLGMTAIRVRRPEGLHYHLDPCSPADAPHLNVSNLADLPSLLIEK